MNKRQSYEDQLQDSNLRAPGLFKPVRLLVLPAGGGMVALMHEYHADTWCVFSVNARGVPAHSKVYTMKSVSEVMWRELCDELTVRDKVVLGHKALDEKLPTRERANAALELGRIALANDDRYEDISAKAEQFVATHTPAECEEHLHAGVGRIRGAPGLGRRQR